MMVKWKQYKIGEVADVTSSKRIFLSDYVEVGIPFYRSKEVIEKYNGNVISIELFIKKGQYETIKNKFGVPLKDDILLTSVGTIGVPYKVKENEIFYFKDGNLTWIRKYKKEIDPSFLFQWIRSEIGQKIIQQNLIGSSQSALTIADIKKLKICLPPLPTQKLMASLLSAYDELIEVNNKRIKILEETARELYKEWFVRMRFPGHKQAKFVKGVPEGWKITTINDEVNFKMGQSPKSEYYNEVGEGLPFHQGVGTYGYRFPEHKIFCSVNGRTAEEGDILFSVRAPVGRLNIADRKLIIGRGLSTMRHKKGLNNYLFYLLQNEFSREDIIGNGAIFNSVGKDELKNFKIFEIGNLAQKFNEWVKPIDEQLLILIQQNTQLRQIRDRLLPRLISGRLEVKTEKVLLNSETETKYN